MFAPLLLGLTCLLLLGLSLRLFYLAMRKTGNERVLSRLTEGQPELVTVASPAGPLRNHLDRLFLRAGLDRPGERLVLWLVVWMALVFLGGLSVGVVGLVLVLLIPPLGLRLFVGWRYRRRVRRMVEQLPQMLDYAVRSLKSGRTLADAILGGIEASADPLRESMARIRRNVELGVSLPEAASDFAEFYEREEFRFLALGLKVNHRYGGNASELLENLMKLIRERDQAARQLRAMTGETRMTAVVLALLPISVAGYFMVTNPGYLLNMWQDPSGQRMLLFSFGLQALGCLALWRMLRSV
ncbi:MULTISPECIES: type II secretion system F family protein [Pseudomonas]|uniref:Type II secretion system protein F (GspF) n=1 Tax=Pseudomonas asplenii TaxID=53407 RepID=A0A0M9GJP6_9PSED|nr:MULTISPECIES: type II secretion system F family protein [Pseudomonas]KPA92646.1 type II secretion system protein F (GspF) [Pseudomonas fuscovaginae]KPA95442.1 Flp pilus assembly protein TadB [Pseudomonas fuscovaginae]